MDGCRALSAMADCYPEDDYDEGLYAGCFEMVVAATRAHGEDADMQHLGCSALRGIADADADADWNKPKAVVAAMIADSGVVAVQMFGIKQLYVLLGRDPELDMAIADAGGIEAVADAMIAHVGVDDVRMQGCSVLACLAENDKLHVPIADACGIEAVGGC